MNDVHALSGAYALDAVTDDERAAFERHLAVCGSCREEVASLRETAAELSSLTYEEPSPALRGTLLEAVSSTRQLPPVVPEPPRRQPRRGWLVAAAAAVIVGGVAVGVTQPWRDDAPSQVLTVTDRVLADPQAQHITQRFDDGAEATVVKSDELGRAVLVTHDMPDAPQGHSYVVWLQQGDEMVRAATMPQGPNNTVLLSGDASTASAAGVTVETDPEAAAPTQDPIALFAF